MIAAKLAAVEAAKVETEFDKVETVEETENTVELTEATSEETAVMTELLTGAYPRAEITEPEVTEPPPDPPAVIQEKLAPLKLIA